MRYVLLLTCGLAMSAAGCKTIQYTAGVCDCDPPPVHSVLQSPYTPIQQLGVGAPAVPGANGAHGANGDHGVPAVPGAAVGPAGPTVVPVMPHVVPGQ